MVPHLRDPDRIEVIDTPDDDFLVCDWYYPDTPHASASRLAIISHGLESNSRAGYVRRMIRVMLDAGWTVLAWNFRSCSGEMNRAFRVYHSGATDDLATIVKMATKTGQWEKVALIGFSLGGNLTLKYAGEAPDDLPESISAVVGISVPCHLDSASREMARPENRLYMQRFLSSLKRKVRFKAEQFPGRIKLDGLERIETFHDFDDRYTAPIHGFESAMDYYSQASSLQFLDRIRVRSLLLNARSDPFLSDECFPVELAHQSSLFHLDAPEDGGHVGFISGGARPSFWLFDRVRQFIVRPEVE